MLNLILLPTFAAKLSLKICLIISVGNPFQEARTLSTDFKRMRQTLLFYMGNPAHFFNMDLRSITCVAAQEFQLSEESMGLQLDISEIC